jgi:hypothetical protein
MPIQYVLRGKELAAYQRRQALRKFPQGKVFVCVMDVGCQSGTSDRGNSVFWWWSCHAVGGVAMELPRIALNQDVDPRKHKSGATTLCHYSSCFITEH